MDASPVDTSPSEAQRPEQKASDTVAGFLAALSIFASLVATVWHPLRLVIASLLIAFVAAGMAGPGSRRLAGVAVAVGGVCFFIGMAVAVILSHPIW